MIRAKHYDETIVRLANNPTVQDMAIELKDHLGGNLHNDGSPRFELMMAANREFSRRGGEDDGHRHIGAIAEAMLCLIRGGK